MNSCGVATLSSSALSFIVSASSPSYLQFTISVTWGQHNHTRTGLMSGLTRKNWLQSKPQSPRTWKSGQVFFHTHCSTDWNTRWAYWKEQLFFYNWKSLSKEYVICIRKLFVIMNFKLGFKGWGAGWKSEWCLSYLCMEPYIVVKPFGTNVRLLCLNLPWYFGQVI